VREAQAEARKVIEPIVDECQTIGWKSVLGTSGSFKVVKQAMFELYGDSHITEKRVRRLTSLFIKAKTSDKLGLESVEESRFTITASPLAIISSFMDLFAIKEINVSNAALREGVLYGLSSIEEDIEPRARTVKNLLELHNVDQVFSKRVLLQLKLFNEQLSDQGQGLPDTQFMFLQYASLLHEIGISIHSKKRQKHGAYMLEHSDMPGFSEQEQRVIASIVGHHRGKINEIGSFDLVSNKEYLQLIQLLRVAVVLTQGRREFPMQLAKISYDDAQLVLKIPAILFKDNNLFSLLEKEVSQQLKAGVSLIVIAEAVEL
jgi:exopolyphosphatase/guanosine-5'-triphosphate,3'-diphosphate pyrophosphatase